MNKEFVNEQIGKLQQQLHDLNDALTQIQQERSKLLTQRFDLKEQRRYFRRQLREAQVQGNEARIQSTTERLDAIQSQLDQLEDQIDQLQDAMEELEADISDIQEDLEDIEEHCDENEYIFHKEIHLDSEGLDSAMDSLNRGLQKLLGKVSDTLESIDFDNLGKNVQDTATRAAKTVSTVAQDVAKEVGTAYKDRKENRDAPEGIGDYRISGSGVLDGGCYNRITVAGSCKVSSDLVCRELRSSGSFKACGSVDVSGETRTSGAFKCEGDLTCGSFQGSGSTKIGGNLKSGPVHVPGVLSVVGGISASEIKVTGSLTTGDDCEADSFMASGCLTIGGIINADTVAIVLSKSESQICSIGGSSVTVSQSPATGFLSNLLPSYGTLSCDSIEGDEIDLTGVHAQIVRGTNVVIRSGCQIDKVEYSDTCSIDGNAVVGSCVKI